MGRTEQALTHDLPGARIREGSDRPRSGQILGGNQGAPRSSLGSHKPQHSMWITRNTTNTRCGSGRQDAKGVPLLRTTWTRPPARACTNESDNTPTTARARTRGQTLPKGKGWVGDWQCGCKRSPRKTPKPSVVQNKTPTDSLHAMQHPAKKPGS
jgi:hypothetical protein